MTTILIDRINDGSKDITHNSLPLHIRAVADGDEDALFALFASLSPDDLRYRFLTPLRAVSRDHDDQMVAIDRHAIEHLLAFEAGERLVGSAMLAIDHDGQSAEIAIAVAGDRREAGIGSALFAHVVEQARLRGLRRIYTVEAADTAHSRAGTQHHGFVASPLPGDASLTLLEAELA